VLYPRPRLPGLLCEAPSGTSPAPCGGVYPPCFILLIIAHIFQRWTGSNFVEVSLKLLGLKVQLNHASNLCENPSPCHAALLVLHTNGIHEMAVQYCGCSRAIPSHVQLLRRGLYPASQKMVKTCATFTLLDLRHKLALTSKASTYNFYWALKKLTNNTRISVPKFRYRALFHMSMQWRHLKLLKWGGRGHDPAGVAATGAGELAVLCPSCPWPGVNLPDNWEQEPAETKYADLFSSPASSLTQVKVSVYDVSLHGRQFSFEKSISVQLFTRHRAGYGLGIYGAPGRIRELRAQSGQRWSRMYIILLQILFQTNLMLAQVRMCVRLQALAKMNTKFSKGLCYTGVGGVMCGRSEMIMLLGIGNLQKGKRCV